MSGESGMSTGGKLFTIALVIVGGFLFFRIGRVYLEKNSLETGMDELIVADGANMTKKELVENLIGVAKENGITLTAQMIKVKYGPGPSDLGVIITYPDSANLVVTDYKKEFVIDRRYSLASTILHPEMDVEEEEEEEEQYYEGPVSYPPQTDSAPPPPPSHPSNPAGPYPDRAREAAKKYGGR